MSKFEIEIPDLPEGYKAVAYRVPKEGELMLTDDGVDSFESECPWLIVEKIKPRRRVFECISETPRRAVKGEWLDVADIVSNQALFLRDNSQVVADVRHALGVVLANKFIDYTIKSASEESVHQKLAGLKHFQTWWQDNKQEIDQFSVDHTTLQYLKELFRKAYHEGMVTGGKAYAICINEEMKKNET